MACDKTASATDVKSGWPVAYDQQLKNTEGR